MGFKTLFNIQNKQLQESNNDCVYSCKRGTVYKLEKINPASIEQNNSFAPMLLFFFFFFPIQQKHIYFGFKQGN